MGFENGDILDERLNRLDRQTTEKETIEEEKDNFYYFAVKHPNGSEKQKIDGLLTIDSSLFSDREQYYLLRLLRHEGPTWEKIKRFFEKNSIAGIQAFIATEYDRSFGEKILEYGIDNDDSVETFQLFGVTLDTIEMVCKNIEISLKESGALSEEDIVSLVQQIFEAMIRKTKDILTVIINTEEEKSDNAKSVLKGFFTSMHIIEDFFSAESTYEYKTIQMPNGQIPQFLITDLLKRQYKIKFHVREKAEEKAQARINVEIDFNTDNPNEELQKIFYQETEWLNNPKRKGVQKESIFRMGLDLDTSNPIKPGLSLDIGRSAIKSEKRIATGEDLGNLLAETSPESTHTPFSFDPKFANPELFERVATQFKNFIEAKAA